MAKVTIGFGILLILLGPLGYGLSLALGHQSSWTAFIPSIAGAVFTALGVVALNPAARKHAMHVAAALSLLLIVFTFRGVLGTVTLLGGGSVERPLAAVMRAVTALLAVAFLALCVRSFVAARRGRVEAVGA